MTKSKIFLYFCLSFIFGIGSSSFFRISQILLLGLLILAIILITVLRRQKKIIIIGFCILFFIVGILRYQKIESGIMNNELRKYNDSIEKVALVGVVMNEPDVKEKVVILTIGVEQLTINNKQLTVNGRVLVTANRYPEYDYGDKVAIIGKLKSPSEDIEGFNYRNYLLKDKIYSVMEWPEIKLLGKGFGSKFMATLFSFKNRFKETTSKFLPFPQEGFLEALLFGDEENISKDWKEKLNITGTRHIAAVSGMNITILSSIILSFALGLGFWRHQAFYLSLFIIFIYILLIGAPSSAIRAGIMAGALMLATYFGRLGSASRAVVFAASLMLFNNPLLLRYDIGFQLSFLAILGMIYFQQFFSTLLRRIPNPNIFPVRTTLAATLSAQIFTLPILIYNFGRISLVSPLTNILIVPFLALITILCFFFGFAGIIFNPLGFVFSLFVWLSLTYLTFIIELFSNFSLASLSLGNIHWIWLLIFYILLATVTYRIQESQKLKFLNY